MDVTTLNHNESTKKALPSVSRIWWRALCDTRSATLLFLFLFFLAMPVALLVIGKEGYLLLVNNVVFSSQDFFLLLSGVNSVFLFLHLLILLLSVAAVIVLVNLNFRFLFEKPSVDMWFSAPYKRTDLFIARFGATVTSLVMIFAGNAIFTSGVLYAWQEQAILRSYGPVYAITFLSALTLAAFTTVVFCLSGRLFDANFFNLAFQVAWAASLAITLQPFRQGVPGASVKKQIIFSLAPIADMFYVLLEKNTVWVRLFLLFLVWTVIGILVMRRRPAERAEVAIGRLKWHTAVQPLFSLLIALLLAQFIDGIFRTNETWFGGHSVPFVVGLFVGAFLGQLASSSISRKPRDRAASHGKKTAHMPWILREWLLSLIGVALYFALNAVP